jgi:phenylacetate-CoA ligase
VNTFRRPFEAADPEAIARLYPPPPEYFETAWLATPEEIERTQLERLRARALTAAKVPFFARRWEAAGFDPASITTLDDLWRAPAYTVDDIRRSIEDHPPWGDYQGVTPADATREPMRVFMSGGTTGRSRPPI